MNVIEFSKLDRNEQDSVLESLEQLTCPYWIKRIALGLTVIILLSMGLGPIYSVWEQGLTGKAELARAEQNRQIAIQEALAVKESAQHKADAEAIRATGIKQANQTIAEGLGGPDGYLRYLYIEALQASNCQTIYVPTEAGMPIQEVVRNVTSRLSKD